MNKKSAKRKRAEWVRAYHSEERVEWMRAHPCVACGGGPCETHHIITGGVGRKADYDLTIPLCAECHHGWHAQGGLTFCREHNLDPRKAAQYIEDQWQLDNKEEA